MLSCLFFPCCWFSRLTEIPRHCLTKILLSFGSAVDRQLCRTTSLVVGKFFSAFTKLILGSSMCFMSASLSFSSAVLLHISVCICICFLRIQTSRLVLVLLVCENVAVHRLLRNTTATRTCRTVCRWCRSYFILRVSAQYDYAVQIQEIHHSLTLGSCPPTTMSEWLLAVIYSQFFAEILTVRQCFSSFFTFNFILTFHFLFPSVFFTYILLC